jgi:hypothetical protein
MPHSPRWHGGKLWVLESGTGSVLLVDPASGKHEAVAQLSGFARGLAIAGPYAFIGLSKIRATSAMDGVPLAERRDQLRCGIAVIDLRSGQTIAFLDFLDGSGRNLRRATLDQQLLPRSGRVPERLAASHLRYSTQLSLFRATARVQRTTSGSVAKP